MDAVFAVGLINLFFAPMLSVYLYEKKAGRPLKPSLELLFQYGIAAVLLIPLTKALVFFPGRIRHNPIPVESSYYTIAALAAAWLLPKLVPLFQNTSMKVEFKRHDETVETEASNAENAE